LLSKLSTKQLTSKIRKKSQVVNSASEEAKDFDFAVVDSFMIGNIKFIFDVYYCKKCDLDMSIKSIRRYEREQKKLKRAQMKGKR